MFVLLSASLLSAAIPEGYYAGTEGKSGEELKQILHTIIRGHTRISYSAAYTALQNTDEDPLNPQNVILLYTGRSQHEDYQDHGSTYDYEQFGGTYNDSWNREHVWPKSHGFPNDTDTAYTDIHHLRPADRTVNSARGTKDFDWGTIRHDEATECFYDSTVWEPRDAVKGDVARMIFYMTVRYENPNTYDLEMVDYTGTSTYTPYLGKKSTLLEWHLQDPPDDFEQRRNDVIYGIQHNRNPFIDHPEFASYIWGDLPIPPKNMTIQSVTDTSVTLVWSDESDNEEGFHIYVDGNLYHSTTENITQITIAPLHPGTSYLFGVSSFNAAGDSPVITVSGITSGGNSGPVYISEYSDATGLGNFVYEFIELVNTGSADADVSGFIIQQIESTREFILPENCYIPARGLLVLGRYATRGEFEAYWNTELDESVLYINSMNAFPMINGQEQFLLKSPENVLIDPSDGSYTSPIIQEGERARRSFPGNDSEDWYIAPDSTATPGWSPLLDTTFVSVTPPVNPVPKTLHPSAAIYPNPVNHTLNISIQGFRSGPATLRIIDIRGYVHSEKTVELSADKNILQEESQHLSSGIYIVQIIQNHLRTQKKAIILK